MSDKMVDTASLADVQASSDDRNVKIDKVGVRNIDFPIIVQDRDKESQNTVAKVSMFVDLPHQLKGTHMSRLMEILNEHDGIIGVENISTVFDRMLERLEANTAFLNLSFDSDAKYAHFFLILHSWHFWIFWFTYYGSKFH